MKTPTEIIEAIDALPECDQTAVLDAIVPDGEGNYGNGLARLHRLPKNALGGLHEEIAEAEITKLFADPEQLRAELEARVDDESVQFIVRWFLRLEHDARVTRGTIVQAAKNLLDVAIEDMDPEPTLYLPAFEATERLEEHLHSQFEYNGDIRDLEQVRPWLARFIEVTDTLGTVYHEDIVRQIPGVAGCEHESQAIDLLRKLRAADRFAARVQSYRDAGYVEWVQPKLGQKYGGDAVEILPNGYVFGKFTHVVVCTPGSSYGDKVGFDEFENARIAMDRVTRSDVFVKVMKPRERVHGFPVPYKSTILIKAATS